MKQDISSLKQLEQAASQLLECTLPGQIIYLQGDLGAGKTTFTQHYLRQAGVTGAIKSPTYTLFESYELPGQTYVHMDLYRLSDPEELYFLGIEELLNGRDVLLVEWPDKGRGVLPKHDWLLTFAFDGTNRTLTITSA